MDSQEALVAIRRAIRTTLDGKEVAITPETDLIEDKVLDSLDSMVFLMELSQHTGIEFPDSDPVEAGLFKVSILIDFMVANAK